jgi:hypothetical protein
MEYRRRRKESNRKADNNKEPQVKSSTSNAIKELSKDTKDMIDKKIKETKSKKEEPIIKLDLNKTIIEPEEPIAKLDLNKQIDEPEKATSEELKEIEDELDVEEDWDLEDEEEEQK